MGRPSKLTAATTAAICDVIAAGGTRTIAARAAGVHPDTLNGWLRRAAQEDTETTLEADDYTTLRELRALAKTAHVPGYGRLRKADLATAIAAKPDVIEVAGVCLSEVGGQIGEERHFQRDGTGETRAKYINRIHSRTMAITPEAETLFRIDLPPSSRYRCRITEPGGLSPPRCWQRHWRRLGLGSMSLNEANS